MSEQSGSGEISDETKNVIKKIQAGGGSSEIKISKPQISNEGGGGGGIDPKYSETSKSPDKLTNEYSKEYNNHMEYPSRHEIDAKLETIEVKMDSRMTRIEEALKGITQSQAEVLSSNRSTRTTIVVTGVSSVLAVVLGVGAFNATVLSNMVASFESGKNTATLLTTAEKSIVEATKSLEAAMAKSKDLERAQGTDSKSSHNEK